MRHAAPASPRLPVLPVLPVFSVHRVHRVLVCLVRLPCLLCLLCLLAPALSGCRSDSSSGSDASVDSCAGLDEAGCEADSDCRSIRGAPAEEVCIEDYSNWATIWAGCISATAGCGDAETCASDPVTGERLFFPNGCVPTDWSSCSCEAGSTCENGGERFELGRLCVRGTPGETGELITADARVVVEATPLGCHSSGCVLIHDRVCDTVASGSDIAVNSLFCLGPSGSDSCLPDCGGAGFATCHTEVLAAGSYAVSAGELSIAFDVPSEVPFGGLCDGDPLM